ncbi:MAG: beta-galactosidase [Armatimonadetes bacterium]|nr:beta-galactosidase [Armatimonadota bacterium]
MHPLPRSALGLLLAVALSAAAHATVHLSVSDPKLTNEYGGQRFVQSVTFANELALYTLPYDIIRDADKPGECRSHWWAWTGQQTTLGMTEPSNANWYFQAFFNWRFDDESLHNRPATMQVIRDGGADAMVQYTWDTPKVTAHLRFALPDGGDKLLMLARYEPKVEIKRSWMVLTCYPTGFAEPRNRCVTTATRTVPAGRQLGLDPAKERWVLYEDTTEKRPGDGSAGLLIGTPDSFDKVAIPVGGYGITTQLDLKPAARSFALAFYDFPGIPEYPVTRDYFRASADAEAAWLERSAAGPALPSVAYPLQAARREAIVAKGRDLFDRPAERWTPDPAPLPFPWAAKLAGGPLRTVIFTPRFGAWETMELARRVEMQADHLYFDTRSALVAPEAWPYHGSTGVGPLGYGLAAARSAVWADQPAVELYLVAGVSGAAVPPLTRRSILERVRAGKGLFLAGRPGEVDAWPKEAFATPDPELAQAVLDSFPWETIPGGRPGERGRVGDEPPLRAYRYGQGRVVVWRMNLGEYSSLVPLNDATEGLELATDHWLALAAKACLAAAGRPAGLAAATLSADGRSLSVEGTGTVAARVCDDLGRTLGTASGRAGRPLALPGRTGVRAGWIDVALLDDTGRCVDIASRYVAPASRVTVRDVRLTPSRVVHEPGPPMVALPDGGKLAATATVTGAPAGAVVDWAVSDETGRALAYSCSALPAGGRTGTALQLCRPTVIGHQLDVSVKAGGREVAFERLRFTISRPYPYDDYTALMWTYAGGEPVLQREMRRCWELGAAMQDLCHMGGYTDAGAAREYAVAARSGLRLVPYVTRLDGSSDANGFRTPCLHDPAYLRTVNEALTRTCRQAAPYAPAAFTLGDENYFLPGSGDGDYRPETLAVFRPWLAAKYRDIAALNAAWGTDFASFDAVADVPLLPQVAGRTAGFAPWIDHKRFMLADLAHAHAGTVRSQVPGAKVGWDGLWGYGWQPGYDFAALTANLELNQTYTQNFNQGEYVRSFHRPGALTGKWGNGTADSEGGFSAQVWDGLLSGDNSVWWWTSWGCDYIPFNPDLSPTPYGQGFFAAVRETGSGPGKLLLHAQRQTSGVGLLYNPSDMLAGAVFAEMKLSPEYSGDAQYEQQHERLLTCLLDLGVQYRHLTWEQIAAGALTNDAFRVFCLTLPSCLSDAQAAALRRFVEGGGTLLIDGRPGLLTGDGAIRTTRALDALLGVTSPAGMEGVTQAARGGETRLSGRLGKADIAAGPLTLTALEPGLKLNGAVALGSVDGAPAGIVNTVGQGRTVLLNFPAGQVAEERMKPDQPLLDLLGTVLEQAGARPPCALTTKAGQRPMVSRRVLWRDGANAYLALQHDLRQPGLADQPARVTLPSPAFVYDLRAGKPVGAGKVSAWDVTLSRNRPLVYALLAYRVTGLAVPATLKAKQGDTLRPPVAVRASGAPGYHVVRVEVYPPGAESPSRVYGENVACPAGRGTATLGLALNDPPGVWRLRWRDAASGVRAETVVHVVRR